MNTWGDHAYVAILRVHAELPADCTLKDRIKAIDAAYPFGERKYFPYKAWLKERRNYLARYGYLKRGLSKTPLELAIDQHTVAP